MSSPGNPILDLTTDKPPRRRRRIPLSLRMFVAMLVILGVSSALWVGVPTYRQYAAIREIQRLGGRAEFCRTGPRWLRRLAGAERMQVFDRCYSITLDKTAATDDTLRHISRLEIGPTGLSLSNTLVTDAGLASLTRLTDLRSLMLDGTQVTDAGAAHLKCMTKLAALDLSATNVTDNCVAELARALPECEIFR